MKAIRRMAALAAAGAMAVGATACQPPAPFFASTTSTGYAVSNGYQPAVGDFDGDGWDDIVFLDPAGWDALWEGRPDGRFVHLSAPARLDGRFSPVVGDFGGDGTDDILWRAWDVDADSVLWVMQAGGGLASSRLVTTLPQYSDVSVIEESSGHDALAIDSFNGDVGIWDPDSGTDAVAPLGDGSSWTDSQAGDLDGDGVGDVFLHRPGRAADEIAWGDGDGTYTITPTTNVGGSYQMFVLQADGRDGDDIAFVDETVGRPWALNLWFSSGDRTFTRQAFTPLPKRGIIRVHRSHVDGVEHLVKYSNGGAFAWSYAPSGATLSATTPLPGPGTTPAFVGRFHGGVADDAFVYDDEGRYREAFLRTPDRRR